MAAGAGLFVESRIRVGVRDVVAAEGAVRAVAALLAAGDPAADVPVQRIEAALLERERIATTAAGEGLAFPHAKVAGLREPRTALLVLAPPGADMGAPDGAPVRIVAALVVPLQEAGDHLGLLGTMARLMRSAAVRSALLEARDAAAALLAMGRDAG